MPSNVWEIFCHGHCVHRGGRLSPPSVWELPEGWGCGPSSTWGTFRALCLTGVVPPFAPPNWELSEGRDRMLPQRSSFPAQRLYKAARQTPWLSFLPGKAL